MKISVLGWALAAICACGVADASLLDVQFYGTNFSSSTASGAAVLGQAGDQWNSIGAGNFSSSTDFGPYNLLDTAGNSTAVTLNFTAMGGIVSAGTGSQPDPDLTNTYLYDNSGGSIDLALNGLLPNMNYLLVLYVASDDSGSGSRSLTGTANGTAFSATGDPQSTFINGENMVEFAVSSDSSGALSIAENNPGNASGEVDLNGFQLQTAPEPSTLGLICFGAALMARRALRRG